MFGCCAKVPRKSNFGVSASLVVEVRADDAIPDPTIRQANPVTVRRTLTSLRRMMISPRSAPILRLVASARQEVHAVGLWRRSFCSLGKGLRAQVTKRCRRPEGMMEKRPTGGDAQGCGCSNLPGLLRF